MKERLYRSRKNRVIGGVAAGFAEYLNIDVILVRVIFVVLTILHGAGLLLYIILWIVVPEDKSLQPQTDVKIDSKPSDDKVEAKPALEGLKEPVKKSAGRGRLFFGIILIAFGIIFLLDRIFPYFDFVDIFPIILIIIGIIFLFNSL